MPDVIPTSDETLESSDLSTRAVPDMHKYKMTGWFGIASAVLGVAKFILPDHKTAEPVLLCISMLLYDFVCWQYLKPLLKVQARLIICMTIATGIGFWTWHRMERVGPSVNKNQSTIESPRLERLADKIEQKGEGPCSNIIAGRDAIVTCDPAKGRKAD